MGAFMVTATFRFYEELNDFLPPERRKQEISVRCARAATTKHMIEALGVPHTEVELVLVNGESVGFERILRDGDRVAVYPKFEAFDVTPLLRVRERPLRITRCAWQASTPSTTTFTTTGKSSASPPPRAASSSPAIGSC